MNHSIKDGYYINEVFHVGKTGVQAAIDTVSSTTTIFASPLGRQVHYSPVPGNEKYYYINWGDDNRQPEHVLDMLGSDEVTSQNQFFNVLTCYGSGLQYTDKMTREVTQNEEIQDFFFDNALNQFLLEQVTDLKHFFFCVCVLQLSRDGKRIVRLRHKEACFCRFEKADNLGRINHVFYANWSNLNDEQDVETIPLLDFYNPLGDLQTRLGQAPDSNGRYHETKERTFAMCLRFPTPGSEYYPTPYYAAIFRSGSFDEKRMISVGKRAKLKNHTSVKYQVEVHKDYWRHICEQENIISPEKQVERIKKEKENIESFVEGVANAGKVWITGYYIDPNGKEIRMVRIVNLETYKEGGDWNEDLQAVANDICYAFNIHPNLVGAVPGKSQSNNSGSDKRELFTLKQAIETASHDLLLRVHWVIIRFNGWRKEVYPTIPMILLTTLDQHTDAKKVDNNSKP